MPESFLQRIAFDLAGQQAVELGDIGREIVRIGDFRPANPRQFFAAVTHHLAKIVVDLQDLFLRRRDSHAYQPQLEVAPEPCLAFPQRLLRNLASRDVTGKASGSQHFPLVIDKWTSDCVKPELDAILVGQQLLMLQCLPRLHDIAIPVPETFGHFRWEEFEAGFSQNVFRFDTKEAAPSRVDGEKASFFVFEPSGVWNRIQDGPLPLFALPQGHFRLLAFRDVHVDTEDAVDLIAVPNRNDEVVVRSCLPVYVCLRFPFHPFASKGSAVVVEPQLATVLAGGTFFGPLADDVSQVLPANGILQNVLAIGTDGKELEGEAFNGGAEDRLEATALPHVPRLGGRGGRT